MKKRRIYINYYFSLLLAALVLSCVEPFEIDKDSHDSVLVVEATITDEYKHQVIKLSRSYKLIEKVPAPASNAEVIIESSNGEEYLFSETGLGLYRSIEEFAAQPNVKYQLKIITSEGETYISDETVLAQGANIEDLYAERILSNEEKDGIAILVDTEESGSGSGYFRFNFEETYKIVTPLSRSKELVAPAPPAVGLSLVDKEENTDVCYNTTFSNRIILSNTTDLTGEKFEGFLVNFINSSHPSLDHRYSILVSQYALSQEGYHYLETLQEMLGSGNLFSQIQPGFLNGNIHSAENSDEKVIGFFNVSSVDQERIFFDHEDFFDPIEEEGPTFDETCLPMNLSLKETSSRVYNGSVQYYSWNAIEGYKVVRRGCVDCRVFGTTKKPEFWVD